MNIGSLPEIRTYEVVKYHGCPIYIRSRGSEFEYLTIIKGQLYTFNIDMAPEKYAILLNWLGIMKALYTDKQLKALIYYMRSMAQATIETVLGLNDGKNVPEQLNISKKDVRNLKKNAEGAKGSNPKSS